MIAAVVLSLVTACAQSSAPGANTNIPRTASGRPNLQGIWQVRNRRPPTCRITSRGTRCRPAAASWRATRSRTSRGRREEAARTAANRATADPLSQVLHARRAADHVHASSRSRSSRRHDHVAMTFEWSQVLPPDLHERLQAARRDRVLDGRLARPLGRRHAGRRRHEPQRQDVVRHGRQLPQRGAARGRALHDDRRQHHPVRGRRSRIRRCSRGRGRCRMPLHRHTDIDRLLEYQCQAEAEEANGDFERDPKTWYPGPSASAEATARTERRGSRGDRRRVQPRRPRGRSGACPTASPICPGYFQPDGGGANYGLEHASAGLPDARRPRRHRRSARRPAADAALGRRRSRRAACTPERGYDDPTAHCFVAGVPRSMYVPVADSHPPAARLRRHAARADVVAHRSPRRAPAPARHHPAVAGRLGRPVGRRHAGRRDART